MIEISQKEVGSVNNQENGHSVVCWPAIRLDILHR